METPMLVGGAALQQKNMRGPGEAPTLIGGAAPQPQKMWGQKETHKGRTTAAKLKKYLGGKHVARHILEGWQDKIMQARPWELARLNILVLQAARHHQGVSSFATHFTAHLPKTHCV
eukprot:511739-Pelagomonas_calceolata.AAC.1